MFLAIFVILVVSSLLAIFYAIREERLTNKKLSDQKIRINYLESELDKRGKEKEETLTKLKSEFGSKEKELNTQILELKDKLLDSQDALKKENLSKLTLEKRFQEIQDQLIKLNQDSASRLEMYEGLKTQYNELERDIEKLQQELTNKDSALKAEQAQYQQLKEKYDTLFPAEKRDPA